MGPSLAVCVINHQGRDVLASTLAAVRAQRPPPAEIVLVDNASTDGGPDLVRASFPEVRVVRLPENRGPGPARDAGYRAVAADLVGFVDNDVCRRPTVSPCWRRGWSKPRVPPWRCPGSSMPTRRSGSSSRAPRPTSSA